MQARSIIVYDRTQKRLLVLIRAEVLFLRLPASVLFSCLSINSNNFTAALPEQLLLQYKLYVTFLFKCIPVGGITLPHASQLQVNEHNIVGRRDTSAAVYRICLGYPCVMLKRVECGRDFIERCDNENDNRTSHQIELLRYSRRGVTGAVAGAAVVWP
jgi:hypothetical protein